MRWRSLPSDPGGGPVRIPLGIRDAHAKVLGRYVRGQGLVDLVEATRRMTIEPARRLERRVSAMARKGRGPCARRRGGAAVERG